MPIDILAIEALQIYETGEPKVARRRSARDLSLTEWQKRWDESKEEHWTFSFMPNVERTTKRRDDKMG